MRASDTSHGSDLIELRGLRIIGVHGLLATEQTMPQPFEVDIDIELDLRTAGGTDSLADTVDYGAVAEAVTAAVAGPPAALLEHLAERIARDAMTACVGVRISAVTVAVRKLRPPVSVDLASAGVRIRRRPDQLAARPPRSPA